MTTSSGENAVSAAPAGGRRLSAWILVTLMLCPPAHAEALSLDQACRLAQENRAEIRAARDKAEAAQQRPAIVGALDDPMISPSIDHYPDEAMAPEEGMPPEPRYDWSIAVEQRFPLSGLLSHRRRAAQADAARAGTDAERVTLDVRRDAAQAFAMLHERRRMTAVAAEQRLLAQQLVEAAAARYAAGSSSQADVLRAEVEAARALATVTSLDAEARGAGAMFNVSLGRPADAPLPDLQSPADDAEVPSWAAVHEAALRQRPELRGGSAEIDRADAGVDEMRSMYWPMAMLRVGRASTMAEGPGVMAMVGVSLPIWIGKLRAGVREAQAMQSMARADLEAMRRMVEGEAAAARESVVAARAQYLALRDDVVPRARRALAPALSDYAAGRSALAAVLEAAQALASTQAEQVMAESALGLAWARLHRAMGETGEKP